MDIVEKIRQIRKQKKLKQKDLAEKIFMSTENYKAIEYGRSRLSLETYLQICKALEISPMELLKENNYEHFILLNDNDIIDLNRVLKKINNQSNTDYTNNSISIGDNNTIRNSFNKK